MVVSKEGQLIILIKKTRMAVLL